MVKVMLKLVLMGDDLPDTCTIKSKRTRPLVFFKFLGMAKCRKSMLPTFIAKVITSGFRG